MLQQFPGSEAARAEGCSCGSRGGCLGVSPAPGGAAGACPQCWAVRAVPGPIPSVLFPIWGIASVPAPCVVKAVIPAAVWKGIAQCWACASQSSPWELQGQPWVVFYSFCDLTIHTPHLVIRFPFLGITFS